MSSLASWPSPINGRNSGYLGLLFNDDTHSWWAGLHTDGNRIDNMWRHGQRLKHLLVSHGVPAADIVSRQTGFSGVSLPGFYRPSKEWDFIVCKGMSGGFDSRRVVAAVEFKSQLGSVAKNQPNRIEEAVGNITDLRKSQAAGLLGPENHHVWVGYCMLCCPKVDEIRRVTSVRQGILPIDPVFKLHAPDRGNAELGRIVGVDYIQRYGIAFDRLTGSDQYDRMCFMLTSEELVATSERYIEPFASHGADEFADSLLKHVLEAY